MCQRPDDQGQRFPSLVPYVDNRNHAAHADMGLAAAGLFALARPQIHGAERDSAAAHAGSAADFLRLGRARNAQRARRPRSALGGFCAALVVGALLGRALAYRQATPEFAPGLGQVRRPGSCIPLLLIMFAFVSKYALSVYLPYHPELAQTAGYGGFYGLVFVRPYGRCVLGGDVRAARAHRTRCGHRPYAGERAAGAVRGAAVGSGPRLAARALAGID